MSDGMETQHIIGHYLFIQIQACTEVVLVIKSVH